MQHVQIFFFSMQCDYGLLGFSRPLTCHSRGTSSWTFLPNSGLFQRAIVALEHISLAQTFPELYCSLRLSLHILSPFIGVRPAAQFEGSPASHVLYLSQAFSTIHICMYNSSSPLLLGRPELILEYSQEQMLSGIQERRRPEVRLQCHSSKGMV